MSSEGFFQQAKDRLYEFDFHRLFIEVLGWNQPSSVGRRPALEGSRAESLTVEEVTYERRRIAEMSEVPVFEVTAPDGEIPKGEERTKIYKAIAESFAENLLIFINGDRTRSLWYWAKREGSKFYPRTDSYIKGQPVDLLLSKIGGLKIDLEDEQKDEDGNLPTFEVADRLQKSLDVEKVTKKFYQEFQLEHQEFLEYVQGIGNEGDRRWYTSVILNRLMFVYFLQKKGFINNGDLKYLRQKLTKSQQDGPNLFYSKFLETLFFEGLAKPERDRTAAVQQMLGEVCYLNGGLFLKHPIELNEQYNIKIADEAFDRVFTLFDKYSWHLDDRPGGKPDEINPDVLGYIFEKYINQKAFGAYYTRPEITEYLCDRTINKLILDRVNAAMAQQPRDPREIQAFESIDDMVMHMDAAICRHLVMGDDAILRNLSLLDPACGSGAFLIAAMKTLIRIYERVVGVAQFSTDHQLHNWLKQIDHDHPSISYFIKKRIITDNLYGVDIMEEAVEIAKLRLFLALVSSAMTVGELEPLPNIDFNIMTGNSLIGLLRVDESAFNQLVPSKGTPTDPTQINLMGETVVQGSLLGLEAANRYREILEEKNRNIEMYKKHAFQPDSQRHPDHRPQIDAILELRNQIDKLNRDSQIKLNQILLTEFVHKLGIRYEQAQLKGRPKKRNLTIADIEALKPFHWGYQFDRVMARGGFDAIIANPPWEIFKPDAKEFFAQYSDLVTKKKMDIKQFQKAKKELLRDQEVAAAWLEYQSRYPHVSNYYRSTSQYENQISIVNGRKVGTDINLYKLFVEQCFNLLHANGELGIVIPSGIYTDLGTKQLREMLFSRTLVTGLFCFENRKEIFESVHRSFKIVILTCEKSGQTRSFPAAFMRHNVQEIQSFPNTDSIEIDVGLVRKLSPDSLSVMEFKNQIEYGLAKKISTHPTLNSEKSVYRHIKFARELAPSSNSSLYSTSEKPGLLPIIEGRMVHQFTHQHSVDYKYWISEQDAREILLRDTVDNDQKLDYQVCRLAFRKIARSTDVRTMISTIIPPHLCAENLQTVKVFSDEGNRVVNNREMLFVCAIWNSFVYDSILRLKVSANINFFFVYSTQVPSVQEGDPYFSDIVERAAKLICTTPEFDDLAAEVGLGSHTNGVTDEAEHAQLRAELDGMIAHLYGLTEAEFTHILSTFPIVPEDTKQAALEEYRKLLPSVGDQAIINLITQGESAQLEFKSTARWDLKENKKSKVMEEVILKTVAAFLNTNGGTLLIGVADDGTVLGLQPDYQTLKKKDRDGYELWLMNDLLLKEFGKATAPFINISFGLVDGKDVCRITVQPGPEPTYVTVKDPKSGQPVECFFIRTGNSTNKLDKPSDIAKYLASRWPPTSS